LRVYVEAVTYKYIKRHTTLTCNGISQFQYWNRTLSKKSCNLDSERCMAKACAYLCRQCCFIDGFSDFGKVQPEEFVHVWRKTRCSKVAQVWLNFKR